MVCVVGFYYHYTKDLFHPGLIFLGIWFLTCSMSCVDLNNFMAPWCPEMYVVTILSSFSFFVGSLFYIRKIPKRQFTPRIHVPFTYTFVVRLLFVICFSCYILEWINGGCVIAVTLDNSVGDLKTEAGDGAIPGIHYGTVFLPYVAILTYFRLLNSSRKSMIDILIIIVILGCSSVFKISRGDMMIFLFSFLFLYSRYYKITLKMLILSGVVLFSILIGFMLLRVNENSIIMTTMDDPFISIIYSYFATSFANLNDYIMAGHPYHLFGNATLAPLWTLLGLKKDMEVVVTQQLGVFNTCTYLYGFYHDFKIIGIIVFPFILGIALSLAYYKASYGYPYWILLLAAMQKATFVPFFGNYFTGEFIIFFPYLLITFIILFVLYYKIRSPLQNFNSVRSSSNGY